MQTRKINGESNAPATKADIEELAVMVAKSQEHLATKEDLKQFATKDDLHALERRLENKFANRDDLHALEQRLGDTFATKEDLKQYSTKDQMDLILQIVRSIEAQLQEWRDIPERLARVEERVFRP